MDGLSGAPLQEFGHGPNFWQPLTGIVGQGCGAALHYPTRTQFCENPTDAPVGLTPLRAHAALPNLATSCAKRWTGSSHPPAASTKTTNPHAPLARRAAGTPLQISPPFAYSRWWLARVLSEAIFLVGGHGFSPYSGALNSGFLSWQCELLTKFAIL